MSKTIISVSLIGQNFMDVLFREITFLATERSLDPEKIQQKIMGSNDISDVNKILKESFENELKLRE